MYFIFSGAVVNDAFKISVSCCSLLVCRNRIEFFMLTFCFKNLLNLIGLLFVDSNVIGKYRKFDFFFAVYMPFISFSLLNWLASPV